MAADDGAGPSRLGGHEKGIDSLSQRKPAQPSIHIGGRPMLMRLDTSERVKRAAQAATEDIAPPAKSPPSRRTSPSVSPIATTKMRVHSAATPVRGQGASCSPFLSRLSPVDTRRRDSAPVPADRIDTDRDTNGSLAPSVAPTRSMSVATGMTAASSFEPSEILEGFLYLGSEISTLAEVAILRNHFGIQCILNAAEEIELGGGEHLNLSEPSSSGFARYKKIPLKDSVEAANVQHHIDDACAFLDEARASDKPVYIHCKAGKSRSVMLVMAYLIHAKRWPLQQAYAYVVERRRGVSPNIGFVAELMAFEARTLRSAQPSQPE